MEWLAAKMKRARSLRSYASYAPNDTLPPKTDAYSDAVYRKAVENFDALKASAPLVTEDSPGLYVYRLKMGSHVQTGVAGTFSIDEYDRGVIKKHEFTRRDKEDDRTRHMLELRAQTGPVFLTYRASSSVDRVCASVLHVGPPFEELTRRAQRRFDRTRSSDAVVTATRHARDQTG